MNTPGSVVWLCMRTRSPRIAPPLNGLVGSTASTPTSRSSARMHATSASVSVDLPAPGAPVIPTDQALPVCGCSRLTTARAPVPPCSTSDSSFAVATRSPASARSTNSSGVLTRTSVEGASSGGFDPRPSITCAQPGHYPGLGICAWLLVGDDLGHARDPVHDDALDARLQRHHR